MIKVCNDLNFSLNKEIINAIYSTAYRLEATYVIINKATRNWVDIALYDNNDCIAEHYQIGQL